MGSGHSGSTSDQNGEVQITATWEEAVVSLCSGWLGGQGQAKKMRT